MATEADTNRSVQTPEPDAAQGLQESSPDDDETPDPAPVKELIYPSGPAMHVAADAVQLTFMDAAQTRATVARSQELAEDGAEAQEFQFTSPLGVRLPVFEGPLDLLLYLIRRDKLDIYDIPIGHMTEQYLAMLGALQVLDLEVAGDFLVMAATLMRLKARMLLPTWPEDEEEDEDPRSELVRQLLEYRTFKEAAARLQDCEGERRQLYGRGFIPEVQVEFPLELEPVSQFALIEAIKDVLARVGEEFFYQVELEDVTLEEKIALVNHELETRGRVLFTDLLLRHPRRIHVVVTFMAILELAKLSRVALAQEAAFSQIWLYRVQDGKLVQDPVGPEATGADPDHAPTTGLMDVPADPGEPEVPEEETRTDGTA